MVSMSFQFLVATSTVSLVVPEVCEAIWEVLKEEVFRPLSQDLWESVAKGFYDKCQFANCFGAVDSRHCIVQVR